MTNHGTFIWNELVTEEPERCGPFYNAVFGWDRTETDAGPFGTYTTFSLDGNDVAGMMTPTGTDYKDAPPPRWNGYIAVDDIDVVVAAAEQAGGTIHEPPQEVPDVGRIAMFSDPSGGRIYVMQPITRSA